jgi:hypothetical protein
MRLWLRYEIRRVRCPRCGVTVELVPWAAPQSWFNVARDKLLDWIAWATRSRLPPFRKVARTIKRHIEGIVAYCATGLNSGRSEGLNG